MFSVRPVNFGKFTQFVLEDKGLKTGFSIVPEAGGTITDIWVEGQSILDGYQTPEELEEGKWGKCAILFPFPNRMRDGRFEWNDASYQFPINNAATGNAIHGFVRHCDFEMTSNHADGNGASCTVTIAYPGDLPYFPFPFSLSIDFSIHKSGEFKVKVSVQNTGKTSFPFGFGWHPYFRLAPVADEHLLTIPSSAKILIDDRMLPTGQTEAFNDWATGKLLGENRFDNCFRSESNYQLSMAAGGKILTLSAAAADFPYFQVFTPPYGTSVALEPMSCNIDALNQQPPALEPGAGWNASFQITIR